MIARMAFCSLQPVQIRLRRVLKTIPAMATREQRSIAAAGWSAADLGATIHSSSGKEPQRPSRSEHRHIASRR
jgi:hypothetical protein